MFETYENTTMSAAIFCPAVCVSDVMNKASMCVRSIKYVRSQPFSALHWQMEPIWLLPEEVIFEAENYFCCVNVDSSNRRTTESQQKKIVALFLCFQVSLRILQGSPLRAKFHS